MALIRTALRILFGGAAKPAPRPDPPATFLELVEHALGDWTPQTVIVEDLPLSCGPRVPSRYNRRETPWEELRPHLAFPFEGCPSERTFPELRIHTREGRDVRIIWVEHHVHPVPIYLEAAQSRRPFPDERNRKDPT